MKFQQRISDAVALAGLEAHASHGRRLVFLLAESSTRTSSRYREDEVRRFLADLQVPVVVWSFEPGPGEDRDRRQPEDAEPWTATRTARMPEEPRPEIVDAFLDTLDEWYREDLARELDRQRVVWLRGDHLPQRIRLSNAAAGVRMAGSPEG
jgi:hypothetical protein